MNKKNILKDEWILELNFDTANKNNHKPLEFIHTMIEALSTIEGVNVTLEDIKIGSIKARLKVVFDDLRGKEEFKDVVESSFKFAKGKLEKAQIENEKIETEKAKNLIENDILVTNLNTLNSPELRELKRLESESLKYDVERKKIENEMLNLELFRKKKDMIKELLAEGIIDQDKFEMLINGVSFMKVDNGEIKIGENIDVIDKM